MNRRHDRDVYLALIDRLRAVRPDIAMSGDFIVGFRVNLIATLPTLCRW